MVIKEENSNVSYEPKVHQLCFKYKKVQMILGKHSAESLNKMDLNWISGKGKPGQEGQTSGSVL